jgi:HD-like signal output (HDOD) protein
MDEERIAGWVARINRTELATLNATVQGVQRVIGDRRSSFAQLSEVLLRDAALSARLLKVANSPAYGVSAEPVTTVTRAATLLGFDAVRSICITSRLLDALLGDGGLAPAVAGRMLNRIASALHAAVQARMMLGGAAERTREEVFLAALLGRIGESAFWSLPAPEVAALDAALSVPGCAPAAAVDEVLGGSFAELSAALLRSWGLDEAVDLASAASGQPEARAIRLAGELADVVAADGWRPRKLEPLFRQIAVLTNLSEEDAAHRARDCARQAQELAACFGAGVLAQRMIGCADTPPPAAGPGAPAMATALSREPDAARQGQALAELAACAGSGADINALLQVAMDGVHEGIGMDRTIAALLSPDRAALQTRLWRGSGGREWSTAFRFDVAEGRNILRDCVTGLAPSRYDCAAPGTQQRLVPRELRRFAQGHDFVLAPIAIGGRAIGVLYADRSPSERAIGEEDFAAFRRLSEQLGRSLLRLAQRSA